MRAFRLGVCIQLASGRRKGASGRDLRGPYDVQTVVARGSFLGWLLPRARAFRWLGGRDGRCRARAQKCDGQANEPADADSPLLCP